MTEADGTELMESQRAHCVNPANSTSSTRLPLKGSSSHDSGLTEKRFYSHPSAIRVCPILLSVLYRKILNTFSSVNSSQQQTKIYSILFIFLYYFRVSLCYLLFL